MEPLVFDVFPYNGDEILPYRIDYLYPYVDYFVISESLETFSGNKKPHYYIDLVLPSLWKYLDKIKIVKIPTFPPMPSYWEVTSNNNPKDWWREHLQKDLCKPTIRELAQGRPYMVIPGDVDEIPNLPYLFSFGKQYTYDRCETPLFFAMEGLCYNFKWAKKYKWIQNYIQNDKQFQTDLVIDHRMFNKGDKYPILNGWHCSFFMSRTNMVKKLESFSHSELNLPQFKTNEWITQCLDTGIDICMRDKHEDCVPNTGELPPNAAQFQNLLLDIQKEHV